MSKNRRWLIPVIAICVVVVAGGGTAAGILLTRDGETGSLSTTSTTQDLTGAVEGFTDIDAADPDLPLARAMAGYGLLSADGEGRFRPLEPVTRADFASLVVTVFSLESAPPTTPTFSDVPAVHPAYVAVETAAPYFAQASGGAAGRTFKPDDPMLRDEAKQVVLLVAQQVMPDGKVDLTDFDLADGPQTLGRIDAARLLLPVIATLQPPAGDSFGVTGIN
jgi:hypothetical protein